MNGDLDARVAATAAAEKASTALGKALRTEFHLSPSECRSVAVETFIRRPTPAVQLHLFHLSEREARAVLDTLRAVREQIKREAEDCPTCEHSWDNHKATANGAYACTSFGCGCRDVVLPEGRRCAT